MRATILLIGYILKDSLPEGYKIRVHKSQGGNLPNRLPFIRRIFRQTTLDEFMEGTGCGSNVKELPKEIIYTIHPRELKAESILDLVDALLTDLDTYINNDR